MIKVCNQTPQKVCALFFSTRKAHLCIPKTKPQLELFKNTKKTKTPKVDYKAEVHAAIEAFSPATVAVQTEKTNYTTYTKYTLKP